MRYKVEQSICGNCTPVEYFLEFNRFCNFCWSWFTADEIDLYWKKTYLKLLKKYIKTCLVVEPSNENISERLSICLNCIEKAKNEYKKSI